jgi:site-specific recombinase XerD
MCISTDVYNITLKDIDLSNCQIKINQGKGKKDRMVVNVRGTTSFQA